MSAFAARGVIFWSFNGGEPLLRENLPDLVRHAGDLGFYRTIVTNGQLLADRMNELRGAEHIEISIDGDEKTHDALRGVGAYKKAVAGLEAAARSGAKVHIFATLLSCNADSETLSHLLALAKEYRVGVEMQPALPWPSHDASSGISPPSIQQLRVLADVAIRLVKQKAPLHVSERYVGSWIHPPKAWCRAGQICCWLDRRLLISPCPTRSDEGVPYAKAISTSGFNNWPQCRMCRLHSYWEINLMMESPVRIVPAFLSAAVKGWPFG
jgi:MoaA/NifB/PqqE/SkfB family radical SAM enzyme